MDAEIDRERPLFIRLQSIGESFQKVPDLRHWRSLEWFAYWPSLPIRLATLTPPRPPIYFTTPRERDSAMRWRYCEVCSLRASPGLLTKDISANMEGMLAPMSTTKGAFLTPRSRIPGLLVASPVCRECCTSPANSRDSSIFSLSAIFFTRS